MYLNDSQGQNVVPEAVLLNTRGMEELLHGAFQGAERPNFPSGAQG